MDKYVIVKGSDGAGLGDRIRAVLLGIAYARISGRILYVDWRDGLYSEKGYNVFHDLFEIKNLQTVDAVNNSSDVAPAIWANHLNMTFSDLVDISQAVFPEWDRDKAISLFSIDVTKLDYEEPYVVLWAYEGLDALVAHFPGLRLGKKWNLEADLANYLFREHLKPLKGIRDQVSNFISGAFGDLVVGVHVRKSKEGISRFVPLNLYHKQLKKILKRHPQAKLFLATDNRDILEAFKEVYGARVISLDKWYPDPDEALHLNPSCPDKSENLQKALCDILLLARCDYLIYPMASSFSLFSAMISDLSGDQVVGLLNQRRATGWQRVKSRLKQLYNSLRNKEND